MDRADLRQARRENAYALFELRNEFGPGVLEWDHYKESLAVYDQLMAGRWPTVVANLRAELEKLEEGTDEYEALDDLINEIEYIEEQAEEEDRNW